MLKAFRYDHISIVLAASMLEISKSRFADAKANHELLEDSAFSYKTHSHPFGKFQKLNDMRGKKR